MPHPSVRRSIATYDRQGPRPNPYHLKLFWQGWKIMAKRVPLAGESWIEDTDGGAAVETHPATALPTEQRYIVIK